MAKQGKIRIGISGWRYPPWRGVLYPAGLRQKEELRYAAGIFSSVEINGTFYSLQRPSSFATWADATPDDFAFAVKGGRFITHMKRLRNIGPSLANFIASGVLRWGPKLGPILWQFPPDFQFDPKRIEDFLKVLPYDTEKASMIARRHDDRLKVRGWLKADAKRPLRHALEVRHDSFGTAAFIELLRKYNVALDCSDAIGWPRWMDVTADFVYCRLHGAEELYASGYDDRALRIWAQRVVDWSQGQEPETAERVIEEPGPKLPFRDVYIYFDNDKKIRAPYDAMRLGELVKQSLAESFTRSCG